MLLPLITPLLWGCFTSRALGGLILTQDSHSAYNDLLDIPHPLHKSRQDSRSSTHSTSTLLSNASISDIDAARLIVKNAIAEMTVLNKARLKNPTRNKYSLKPGTILGKRANSDATPAPLLNITDDIARAAALVAEADSQAHSNSSFAGHAKQAGTFWMETIDRKGTVPWGNDATYKIFRNVVTDYGADSTGQSDSTASIQKAISDGNRCGEDCNGSTQKNAIVYFPPGRYMVSSSIKIYFGTQIIGDANDWPTIFAPASFVGLGVLSTDIYVDSGGVGPDGNALEWYINTSRFYGQIRNLRVDITATDANAYVAGVHYQVAQATTIQNVELIASTGTTQQGMYAENGSGGVMSDITFTGGNFGFYGGSQQFSAARMTFNGCNTAAQVSWDWGWVWKSVTVNGADVGFQLVNPDGSGNIGSVSFIDSTFSNIGTSAIVMGAPSDTPGAGATGLILDNVNLGGQVADSSGKQLTGSGYYKSWVVGVTYADGKRTWQSGTTSLEYTREETLLGDAVDGLDVAPYFERVREQYADKSVDDFVHLKDGGATGDGSTDDTQSVQDFFNSHGDGTKIIFVDAGTYILTDTVTIPKDAKIVGETWSQFAASGDNFADASNPLVMLKVGNVDDKGSVEIQDLILTTKGGTAGAILMEWNVQASSTGAAALWDVHARVGGASGTELTPDECPAITTGTNPSSCQAASLLLHITEYASGYFDNMWLWVADHMVDDPALDDPLNGMTQISVYSARGFLIESKSATWLYGTAAEHNVFYQYNFNGAENIFTTMVQSESPYYQPTPAPPAPFDQVVGQFPGDPDYSCDGGDFDGCDESWAVIMTASQNIHVGAAGTYSWFSTYSQDCIDTHACQKTLWYIDGNYDNNRLEHVVGIGAKYVMVSSGEGVLSTDNLGVTDHPAWAHISVFDVPSSGSAPVTTDPDTMCSINDQMYSTEIMPAGNFMPWYLMDAEDADVSSKYYITIVNLTPYRFVKTSQHSYQFDTFDFDDVPSGKARENTMVYATAASADSVDDNGEAYYALEGTDKTFEIRGTTHIPDEYPWRTVVDLTGMGLGQREYGDPGEEVSVTLVITGSEEYGYITSLTFGANNWMHSLYDVIKDRQLRHIVMPGSHDAGMSSISSSSSGWDGLGESSNTQTQGLGLYNQLRVGSRWFDVRIVSTNGGGFWAAHVNDETSDAPVGATGQSLDDMVTDINSFTAESPGEIIIWWIKYMVDMNLNVPAGSGRYWDDDKANEFYDALEAINNRCPDISATTKFDHLTTQTFLDMNSGAGCVLLMIDGQLQDGITNQRTSSGIYKGTTYMDRDDFWANQDDTEPNADSEVAHMIANTRDGSDSDDFAIMQWQVTPDFLTETFTYGLSSIAILPTNPVLYWEAVNAMTPTIWPTVILQDYIGFIHQNEGNFPDDLGSEIRVLCMGLNLYMVSQNCEVSPSKNPLLVSPSSAAEGRSVVRDNTMATSGNGTAPVVSGPSDPTDHFKGIIYANGTVNDDPPAGLHHGRVQILKAGTVFGNGTILAVDRPNPDFNVTRAF